ncbi:MAG TPA: VTT domain-containing protein [Candidatus Dojkabacteria bacterium]|nr:VTT domain-containing protein [Candidatus Dojkabacteria bacterium]
MISDILVKLTFWMGRLGYPGVFISTVGVLPAEVVITMVAATKTDQIFQIAAVASLGEVVGALWTYAIGYYFKDKDVLGFLNGKGKWMNISEKTFNKSNKYVKKRGFLYIILTRFTPGLRVAVLLVAGYLKYNVFAASVAVFIGTFIYAFGFAYLGSKIGFNWDQIKRVMDMINGGLTILTLSVIGFLIYKNKERLLQLFRKETSK